MKRYFKDPDIGVLAAVNDETIRFQETPQTEQAPAPLEDAGGSTSRVREVLTVSLVLGFFGVYAYLCVVAFNRNNADALELVKSGWTLLLAAVPSVLAFYFGTQFASRN